MYKVFFLYFSRHIFLFRNRTLAFKNYSVEVKNCRASSWHVKYWGGIFFYSANTNQVRRITTDSTPLKFVCRRNLTSVDSLTFSWPIWNAFFYIRFLGAVSKISRICKIVGVFVHCLLPSPSPPSSLVSCFDFGSAFLRL